MVHSIYGDKWRTAAIAALLRLCYCLPFTFITSLLILLSLMIMMMTHSTWRALRASFGFVRYIIIYYGIYIIVFTHKQEGGNESKKRVRQECCTFTEIGENCGERARCENKCRPEKTRF